MWCVIISMKWNYFPLISDAILRHCFDHIVMNGESNAGPGSVYLDCSVQGPACPSPECSTLIGPDPSRLCSDWLRSWCCHKDTIQDTHPTRGFGTNCPNAWCRTLFGPVFLSVSHTSHWNDCKFSLILLIWERDVRRSGGARDPWRNRK